MNCLEEITEYAESCVSGEIMSCKKHRWSCQRFLNDRKRAESDPEYPYTWNEQAAQNIVDWFSMLYHSKGDLAGEPILLTPWQKFRLCQLYGWVRKDTGLRRFRKSYTQIARKNAKSQEEAGVALYEASVTAVKNGEVCEVYTAGVKRDQSKIVFNEAALMLQRSPLRTKFRITKDAITHPVSGSYIKALSKEDGKSGDGTNPALLVIDEFHQHPTTEFYDLGLGGNTKEPLLMIITTAGVDLNCPCYVAEYQYCSRVLDPDTDIEDDEYLIDICELDPEDYENLDNLGDEKLWEKANPIRMSYEGGRDKLRQAYKTASEVPEHMSAFLTKCMDVWIMAKEDGYMNMGKWKTCQVDAIPIDTKGMPVYVGFDMSAKIDLTSVAFVIPFESAEQDPEGKPVIKYIVFSHSFVPSREKLVERKKKDKAPYDAWEREGFLTVTNTPIVDQGTVMRYVLETCKKNKWEIETLCFDPANASKLMMDLSDEGYEVEEVYQSHKSLNESTQGFREQVYSGNILYTYNPVLNFAMSNAVIRRSNGLIKIDKDATTKRIDPVDAVLCAYKLAMYHEFYSAAAEAIDKFLESDW
ncbi:terminase large subunit [Wansuia hejianensis]|uniref:Terminase large subunit n=1 Tax=Wansuia hejianensis TaxID=2763667 RepID=A0A7G9G8P5_9FIRM|nr:terminase TerL endonuclease subunit [Wansuia hejianensis]QNM07177.1 terminase large subunit [Wansuia hejianensis]